jgi:uncharacterized protein involved in exopolysaccharide biosynthesis
MRRGSDYRLPDADATQSYGDASPDDGAGAELRRYLEILRRRKWQLLLPAAILFVVTLVVAFSTPSVFRSTATVLIEEPNIPPDAGRSNAVGSADQHLGTVSRQVMTRANLLRIAEKFDLRGASGGKESAEAVIESMRKNFSLDMINADAGDVRGGNRSAPTIAFTISFDAESPEKAQGVAAELTSLFLAENEQQRRKKTAEASGFFAEEARKSSERISALEAQLARFKEKNYGRLPEWQTLNAQMRDRAETEILETDRQIRALEERKFFLDGQLAQIKPNTPVFSTGGERILDSEDRLKQLQTQLASAVATYSPQHPDVVRMRREIEALRKQGGDVSSATQQAEELTRVRGALKAASEKYAYDHPDVVKLRRSVDALQDAMLASGPPEARVQARHPENPAYIALQAQLQGTKSDLQALRSKQGLLGARAADFGARLAQTPQVEREFLDLSRERENELKRFQEVKARQLEAQAAEALEKDRIGERYSLIEPAQLPERPVRPNRRAMVLLGLVLSLGAGVAVVALFETLDHRVRGAGGLGVVSGLPLLAVIPYIGTDADVVRRRRYRIITASAIILTIAMTLLIQKLFVTPLDGIALVLLGGIGI